LFTHLLLDQSAPLT